MKIKLVSLLMCLLVAVSAIPFAVSAATTKVYTSGKYKYTVLQDGTVEIKEYTGNAKNINIPSKLGNKKVTSIGKSAFYYVTTMESVVIPNTVISIGEKAFYECSKLVDVTMSNNVKNIDYAAFGDCYSLQNINLPTKIKRIEKSVFVLCIKLTSIIIPKSVTIIDDSAFYSCTSLRKVSIPESIEYIGDCAFRDCEKLSVIDLPKSINHIGENSFYDTAFYNDKSNWENDVLYIDGYLIKSNINDYIDYNIKEGTKLIAVEAFRECDRIFSLTFPESLTSIPRDVCYGCDSLKTVNISNSVTYISSYAFEECTHLENINLGNNIERIGEYAFYNTGYYNNISNWDNGVLYINNYLISMKPSYKGKYTVKDGTIGIANSACSDCDPSGYYYYDEEDDIESYFSKQYDETDFNLSGAKWYGCVGLTGIKLPTSVKYIGSHAFDGCDSITSIELNEGLQVIGVNAFNKCKAIDTIKMPNSVSEICNAAIDKNYVKVIEGYKGSAAQTYANDNKFQFVNVVCENNGEHTPVELKAKKATCFERGYTAHTKCSVCGEDLSFVKYTNKTKLNKSSFTLKSGKKSFKITYKKVKDAKGFQVKYKTGKGKWKTKTFNAKKKVTKTIKKLKKGKKYSVKIRAFAKFSGKKVYSNWTAAKKVTVK